MPRLSDRAYLLQSLEAMITWHTVQLQQAKKRYADTQQLIILTASDTDKGSSTEFFELLILDEEDRRVRRLRSNLIMVWEFYQEVESHRYLDTNKRDSVKFHQVPIFQRCFDEPDKEFTVRVRTSAHWIADLTTDALAITGPHA